MIPPLTGLAAAARALRFYERRQEVTSTNLANAETAGFKAERVFAQLVTDGGVALDAPEARSHTDRSAGVLRTTERPLDVAIEGDGFFVVRTPMGEQLTRGGSLHVDPAGMLADGTGALLLGERGPVAIPPGATPAIDSAGVVRVDGAPIDTLRMETVPAGASLVHAGATHFVPPATRTLVPPAQRAVRQGQIEDANVNAVDGLVEMIDTQRAYGTVERAIRVLDDVREAAATQIGRA